MCGWFSVPEVVRRVLFVVEETDGFSKSCESGAAAR